MNLSLISVLVAENNCRHLEKETLLQETHNNRMIVKAKVETRRVFVDFGDVSDLKC